MKSFRFIRSALLLALAANLPAFAQTTAPAPNTAPALGLKNPDKIDEYLAIIQTLEPRDDPSKLQQIDSYKLFAAQILAEKFWSDPRAEKALAEVATPPFMMADAVETPHMFLRRELSKIRAKLRYAEWMKESPTAEKRLKRAREILAVPLKDSHDKTQTMEEFIDARTARDYLIVTTLTESGAPAVDIAVENPWHMAIAAKPYAEKYAGELVNEAQRRGMRWVLDNGELIWRMPFDKEGKWVALLQAWLTEAKDDEDLRRITERLCVSPDGRERCAALLNDARAVVVLEAAQRIHDYYADAAGAKALKGAIARQQALENPFVGAAGITKMQDSLERLEFEAHLKSRELLETLYANENPKIMTRINALRELATRWPDQRTLDLLKKVRAGIPEEMNKSWLARYSDDAIQRIEKLLDAAATQPKP